MVENRFALFGIMLSRSATEEWRHDDAQSLSILHGDHRLPAARAVRGGRALCGVPLCRWRRTTRWGRARCPASTASGCSASASPCCSNPCARRRPARSDEEATDLRGGLTCIALLALLIGAIYIVGFLIALIVVLLPVLPADLEARPRAQRHLRGALGGRGLLRVRLSAGDPARNRPAVLLTPSLAVQKTSSTQGNRPCSRRSPKVSPGSWIPGCC